MADKALALVVRGTDWSETSRITTLFTREFGKVRGLAKGGRRLRSNFEIAFDLLTVCHVVFVRKPNGLDLLTEAQVAERFPHLRTDISALNVGYYVAELLSDGTQDYDPHPALFDAALEVLRGLVPLSPGGRGVRGEGASGIAFPPTPSPSPTRGEGDHRETVSAFELVWLSELGYSPRLEACAVCARELPVPPPEPVRVGYSPEAGGVVCPDCLPGVRDRRPFSAAAWAALKALAPDTAAVRAPVPPLPAAVGKEVRQVLGQTVSFVLGRRPRLLGYLDG